MLLSSAPCGASFKVVNVTLEKEIGKRLVDMGFTAGTEGLVIREGVFRGPFHIRIRGYDILIRHLEAEGIEVEPIGEWQTCDRSCPYHPFRRRKKCE